jgi:glycosyltransferase involved in cell wall biosynthesis
MLKVSIVTVSYNSRQTIEKTIKSIEQQTYDNIEYIVIDGGSNDGTLSVIRDHHKVIDKWVTEEDDGIYDAMNKGIKMSSGNIIGILNSDDWYEKDTISTIVSNFGSSVSLIHGAMKIWSKDGNVKGIYGKKNDLPASFTSPFNHPTCFVSRQVYQDIGLFDTRYSTAADYDFLLRVLRSKYKTQYIDQVLTNFRQGGVTSKQHVPVSQLWQILRRNNYSLDVVVIALGFRLVRAGVVALLSYDRLSRIKNCLRNYIPYHARRS